MREQETIIDRIDARFVSGNEIPVPCILLTREQWAELKIHIDALSDSERNLCK